ncbi:MAG: HD domain-containing protein [Paludibacteraceae bacterium]|nr:HD domain-containing protein [Paludibacteraceae bacterium]
MVITDKKIEAPILHLIGEEADKLQLECYVIGGWVRDLLLHRPCEDIDVVVVGSGIQLAEAVAARLGKGAHLSVFKTYGTAQVKKRLPVTGDGLREIELEFVGARRESYRHDSRNPIVEDGTLEEDQNRRDFTINAMAICLNKDRYGELLDPFDGQYDLEDCIIRTPLDPDITFSDDPLRMMRAIRFASQLGFYLDPETFDAIARNKERIGIITKERINDEINKIMLSRRPSVGWLLLDKTGLLPLIFPELAALKGIETKSGKAHKDVFLHTLKVLDNLAEIERCTKERCTMYEGCKKEGRADVQSTIGDREPNLWLRWAALLHDIGKPKSKAWDPVAGWTFYNHNYIGARMVPRIFKAMKLPLNEKMEYVKKLVDLHMRPINLIEDTVTDSAVRRLLFEAGDDIEDLMMLCDADITSRDEQKVARFHHNYELVRQKMVELEERDRIRNFQPPVKGEEIMSLLHLEPCALVGELKSAIKDAILDGVIENEYEAAKAYLMELAAARGLK